MLHHCVYKHISNLYMCIQPLTKLCQVIVLKIECTTFDAIATLTKPPDFSSPHHFGCVCSLPQSFPRRPTAASSWTSCCCSRKLHVVDHVIICKPCVTRIILGFIDHGTGSLIMVRVHSVMFVYSYKLLSDRASYFIIFGSYTYFYSTVVRAYFKA